MNCWCIKQHGWNSKRHYAKWKNPNSNRGTFCVISLPWHSEKGKIIRTENRSLVIRGCGWGALGCKGIFDLSCGDTQICIFQKHDFLLMKGNFIIFYYRPWRIKRRKKNIAKALSTGLHARIWPASATQVLNTCLTQFLPTCHIKNILIWVELIRESSKSLASKNKPIKQNCFPFPFGSFLLPSLLWDSSSSRPQSWLLLLLTLHPWVMVSVFRSFWSPSKCG